MTRNFSFSFVPTPKKACGKPSAEHGAAVNGVVRRVLRNASQEAEECCADVFVALWRHAEALSDAVPVRAWLLVTARNAAIDRWRKLTRREEFPLYEELTGRQRPARKHKRFGSYAPGVGGKPAVPGP